MAFEVHVDEENDVIVLHLHGALDHEATEFPSEVRRAVLTGKPLVVDLSAIASVQSMGIGMLVEGFKAAKESGRRMVFVGARPQVRAVLNHTKLDTIFELIDSIDEAFDLLRR
ncbi:MAG: STAS domain-containing protein [Candidatus Eisenbacteria bacterium]|uniref:Anti-sigma factor antagonist n=1 Tax=Eiseniibacteriota bacterium TaxID=2212470 RepID=A0A956SDH0_UNCEI|nr:STAS domain-containing protein [Candidatus Eisenbacteria bacterium]MCB9465814.1 STAS domain-containing protein [Candidatus Eisenbacteria bacterium]